MFHVPCSIRLFHSPARLRLSSAHLYGTPQNQKKMFSLSTPRSLAPSLSLSLLLQKTHHSRIFVYRTCRISQQARIRNRAPSSGRPHLRLSHLPDFPASLNTKLRPVASVNRIFVYCTRPQHAPGLSYAPRLCTSTTRAGPLPRATPLYVHSTRRALATRLAAARPQHAPGLSYTPRLCTSTAPAGP